MKNQRAFFRLDFDTNPVNITHQVDDTVTNINVKIRDLSAGGISVYATKEPRLNATYGYRFEFTIYGETFVLQGKLVRTIEEKFQNIYAFQFINLTDKQQNDLAAKMLRFAIKKRQENEKNN